MDKKVQEKKKVQKKTGPNEKIPVDQGFSVFKPMLIGIVISICFVGILFSGAFDKLLFMKSKSNIPAGSSTLSVSENLSSTKVAPTLTSLPPKITPPPKAVQKEFKSSNEVGYKITGGKTTEGTKGWIKEIVKPGDGKTFPKKGDVIVMHYVGKLMNGKVFDSSRERGQPFRTVIGVGRLIKGWDEGVPNMSLGESAILTIHPEYGYGARGAGASIPPNSQLKFEVELLEIIPKNN